MNVLRKFLYACDTQLLQAIADMLGLEKSVYVVEVAAML